MWFFIALAALGADVSAVLFAFAPSAWLPYALLPAGLGALLLAFGMREESRASALVGLVGVGLLAWQVEIFPAVVRMAPWTMAALALAIYHPKEAPVLARAGLVLAGAGTAVFTLLLALTSVDGDFVVIALYIAAAGFAVAWHVQHKSARDSTDWFWLATVAAHTVQAFQLLVPETPVAANVIAYTLVMYYSAVLFFIGMEFWAQTRKRDDADELFSLD